ncbi:DUF6340 family protein [Puia dinghuensis]|uniref:Uncharacterized protein n=1 Tax=Puia dinghuensis TaxID=1792502 RepID=A0A8J2UBH6_9BACT|nr:DUF6340 family protein [Puia dinghuensis]GGA93749.1 hypothetical protein GCM10011511_16300 [Puia dinghuensis]
MKNPSILLGLMVLCYSCSSTNLMSLSVTEPAPVGLPPNIKSAAVVDRSRATDENRTIDALHKALSLESKSLQAEGAKAGVTGLTDELMKNNRFTSVRYLDNLDLRSFGAGVFPTSLPWDTVDSICRLNNVDVLFSLELFDAESKVGIPVPPTNLQTVVSNLPAIAQQVNMNTQVKTGWRIYDPSSRNILDEYIISRDLSFQGHGLDPATAGSGLIGRKEAVKQAAINAGQAYASRILPYSIRVWRYYYVRGDGNFIVAKRMAQTGNWDGAARIWQQETASTSRKAAGRACYNMAIISEINGDLPGAVQWAQKAYEVYGLRLALEYVNVLHHRQSDNAVLKSQTELTSTP